jgi:TRAP-type C4-dicarboxylate transport system substrate-binding protein
MKTLRAIAIVLAGACVTAPVPSLAAEYRFLSSWDKNYPAYPVIVEPFIKGVEAATKGSVKLVFNGPETVPAFEQLQPASAGAFHFLFSHGAYHFGTTPILTAVEAIGGDMQSRRASGIWDWVDKHYQKLGLKLVAIPMTPDGGYGILLRQPVSPGGDLQGRKIRGTASYHSVFKMLGASPVVLPPAEIYTALEKGVVDGAAWPVIGPLNYRWYEVSKFLLRPAFGFVTQPTFVNLATWNKLTEAERKAILDEGRKIEEIWYRESGRLVAEEEKALIGKGMQVTQMGDAQKAKLRKAWSDGLWEMSAQKAKKDVEELRAFAKSKGLAD